MKIINLVGVFLISSFSTPCALKDTPNNLIIEKKEALYGSINNTILDIPFWAVYAPEQDFIYNASFILSDFRLNYETVDNTFNGIYLNSLYFKTALQISTTDYDNTTEIQYYTFIENNITLNKNIDFNNNYGYLDLNTLMNLESTSGHLGIAPYYNTDVELFYRTSSTYELLWTADQDSMTNIFLSFLIWLDGNTEQIIADTGVQNIFNGYITYFRGSLTLIDFNNLKQFYDFGFNVGDTEGYGRGTIDGYNTGYEQGYNVGESNGYSMGFDIGYESGYTDGNEGKGDFDFVWLTTLFNSLNAILSVEILNGFRLWYLFAIPLVVALIVGVMKLLR